MVKACPKRRIARRPHRRNWRRSTRSLPATATHQKRATPPPTSSRANYAYKAQRKLCLFVSSPVDRNHSATAARRRRSELSLCGFAGGEALHYVGLEIEIADQAVQIRRVHAENLGGMSVVAASFFHGGHDAFLLRVADAGVNAVFVGGQNAGFEQGLRKILGEDDLVATEDDSALDRVLEFTHVARPIVLHEQRLGCG